MPITFLLGRAASGKTHTLYARLRAAHAQGQPCILLVPDQYTHQAERELIAALGQGGLLDVEVTSLARLVGRILDSQGRPPLPLLEDTGQAMAVRHALFQLGENALLYAASASRPGFCAQLARALRELKAYGWDADRLGELATANIPSTMAEKLRSLISILSHLQANMAGRLCDREDLVQWALERMEGAAFLRQSCLFVDGLDALSTQRLRLLQQLLSTCKTADVALCIGEGGDDWLFAREYQVYTALRAHALLQGLPVEVLRIDHHPHRPPALLWAQRQLFDRRRRPYAGNPEGIELHTFDDPDREAQSAVRCVVEYQRQTGCRFADIALLTGDGGMQRIALLRALRQYNLPYFADERQRVLHHPLLRAALLAVRAGESNLRAPDVLELAKTGCAGLSLAQALTLERHAAGRGRHTGRGLATPLSDAPTEALRLAVVQPLESLRSWRQTADKRIAALTAYLQKVDAAGAAQELATQLEAAGEEGLAAFQRQGAELLAGVLEQATALLRGTRLGRGELEELLRSALEGEALAVIPPATDALLVGRCGVTKFPPVQAIFWVGCSQQHFFAPTEEDALLGDAEREAADSWGKALGPDTHAHWLDGQLEAYRSLNRASRLFWASVSTCERSGEAISPSPLFLELCALFPHALSSLPEAVGSANFALHQAAVDVGEYARGGGVPSQRAAAAQATALRSQNAAIWAQTLRCVQASFPPTPEPAVSPLLPPRRGISVTALEAYNRCPFAYFVERRLRPQPFAREFFDRLEGGSLLHAAMQTAAQLVMAAGNARSVTPAQAAQTAGDRLDALATEALGKDAAAFLNYRKGALRRTAAAAAARVVEQLQHSAFVPCGVESDLALALTLPEGECQVVCGIPDRWDAWQGLGAPYALVLDYKSSSYAFCFADALAGTALQLPLYLQSIAAGRPGTQPAGGLYLPLYDDVLPEEQVKAHQKLRGFLVRDKEVVQAIAGDSPYAPVRTTRDGGIHGTDDKALLSPEEMQRLLAATTQIAAQTISNMRKGLVPASPVQTGPAPPCTYCAYTAVCRFDPACGSRTRLLDRMDKESFFAAVQKGSDRLPE